METEESFTRSKNNEIINLIVNTIENKEEEPPPITVKPNLNLRRQTINELPSQELRPVETQKKCKKMILRISEMETAKLRWNSVVYRRHSTLTVDLIALVLFQKTSSQILMDLKALNIVMALRRELKDRLVKAKGEVVLHHDDKTCMGFCWFYICYAKNHIIDIIQLFEVWGEQIQKIYGHFGSDIASYFYFVKWLLYLNLLNFFIMFIFVSLPQWSIRNKEILGVDLKQNVTTLMSFESCFIDLFTGVGSFESSLMYYRNYVNHSVQFQFLNIQINNYNIPTAFVLVVLLLGFINLLIIFSSLIDTVCSCINVHSQTSFKYFQMVFCSWDFGIEDKDCVHFQANKLCEDLLDMINYKFRHSDDKTDDLHSCLKTLTRITINCLALCTTLFAYFVITLVMRLFVMAQVGHPMAKYFFLPISITCIMLTNHFLLEYLFTFEDISNETYHELIIIIRLALMRCVMMFSLMYGYVREEEYYSEFKRGKCYECLQGQEIYRLVLYNVFVTTFLFNFILGLRRRVSNLCQIIYGFELGRFRFDIPFHTTSLIFSQTLVWIGMIDAPLLSGLMIILLICIFYSTLHSVIDNCEPASSPLTIAQSEALYLFVTLLCFILAEIDIVYTLVYVKPSTNCGPFRNCDRMIEHLLHAYEDSVENYPNLKIFCDLIFAPSFRLCVCTLLCVFIYYAHVYFSCQNFELEYIENLLKSKSKANQRLLTVYEEYFTENPPEFDPKFDPNLMINKAESEKENAPDTSTMSKRKIKVRVKKKKDDSSKTVKFEGSKKVLKDLNAIVIKMEKGKIAFYFYMQNNKDGEKFSSYSSFSKSGYEQEGAKRKFKKKLNVIGLEEARKLLAASKDDWRTVDTYKFVAAPLTSSSTPVSLEEARKLLYSQGVKLNGIHRKNQFETKNVYSNKEIQPVTDVSEDDTVKIPVKEWLNLLLADAGKNYEQIEEMEEDASEEKEETSDAIERDKQQNFF